MPQLSAQGPIQPQGEGSSGDSRSEHSMESLSAQPGRRRCQSWAAHRDTAVRNLRGDCNSWC